MLVLGRTFSICGVTRRLLCWQAKLDEESLQLRVRGPVTFAQTSIEAEFGSQPVRPGALLVVSLVTLGGVGKNVVSGLSYVRC